MSERRVAVTGAGPVSAIGIGCEAFFDALKNARSGLAPISLFALDGLPVGGITDFNVEDYLETPKAYLDRSSEFAFAAMNLAMADAGLDTDSPARRRTGLVLGSAYGSLGTMELFFNDVLDKGARFAKPFLFPHTYSNTAISLLAIEYGLTGPHLNFASGYVSAANAIIAGYDLVRAGRADIVLAGGYESLSEAMLKGYLAGGVLRSDAAREHGGMIPGEGAGIVVLEELEHARAREAHVYAELTGAGMRSGAHISSGNTAAESLAAVMSAALGGSRPGCISAAANGYPRLDAAEATAIAATLGRNSDDVPVSNIKSMIGETMGAAAALQAIAALHLLEAGGQTTHSVLVNSLDPGGAAAALLLQRPG